MGRSGEGAGGACGVDGGAGVRGGRGAMGRAATTGQGVGRGRTWPAVSRSRSYGIVAASARPGLGMPTGCDGTPGRAGGGLGQTRWLLSPFGRLSAHQLLGHEAWDTLGHGPRAVCLPVQLEALSLSPGARPGWQQWDGGRGEGEALNTQGLVASGELGTEPRGHAPGKSSGKRRRHHGTPGSVPGRSRCASTGQGPSQGGPGVPGGLLPPTLGQPFSLAEGCKGSEMCEGQKEPPSPSL